MKYSDIIKMTAAAAEEHFLVWEKIYEKPFYDLKLIAEVVQVDTWEPGQLAAEIIKEAIVEYDTVVSEEYLYSVFDGELNDCDLSTMQDWIDSTFNQAGLLLLDQILWLKMRIENNP